MHVVVRGVRLHRAVDRRHHRAGFPHSSHSVTVSGRVGSSIVVRQSTKGTCASIALNISGASLATAPTVRPPADAPLATRRSGLAHFESTRCFAQAMKSLNVLRLLQHLAVVVPVTAELASASDVGDGVYESAVDERKPDRGEHRVDRHLVGAVAVDQARCAAVDWCVAAPAAPRSAPVRRRER